MTSKQSLLIGGMFVVLGLVFVRVGQLKANVIPLREVIEKREKQEDMIRFRATTPMIKAVHHKIMQIKDDYSELAGYTQGNLFLFPDHQAHWQQNRRIYFNSLIQNNNRPSAEGITFTVKFCSRRGHRSYCGFSQDQGNHYLCQQNEVPGLGITMSCSIDSNNMELLHAISQICDETAGGTMEVVRQRNVRNMTQNQ